MGTNLCYSGDSHPSFQGAPSFAIMSTVPRENRHAFLRANHTAVESLLTRAQKRVAGLQPDLSVPIRYFDYDKWDKVTKPAEFNMKVPRHLHEEAEKQSSAARLAVHVNTPMYNGRLVDDINLDSTGFSFGTLPTTMNGQDFYDVQTVHTKYFPEVVEHVKALTGATAVMPFDHSVRNATLMRNGTGIGGYVGFAHNDNTYWSGPNRVRQLLKNNGCVDEVLKHRFAIMNLWRRWDGGNDMPLGVCSGDSLLPDDSDLVATDLVYRNRTGEIYYAVHKPEHTFFYFPNMTKHEALVLKVYDSEAVGATPPSTESGKGGMLAKWTLHTAFHHPHHSFKRELNSPGPRESCEVRCLVLWAPEEIAKMAELKGVTGLNGGDKFYDSGLGKYVDKKEESAIMRNVNPGSHDYSKFQK